MGRENASRPRHTLQTVGGTSVGHTGTGPPGSWQAVNPCHSLWLPVSPLVPAPSRSGDVGGLHGQDSPPGTSILTGRQ